MLKGADDEARWTLAYFLLVAVFLAVLVRIFLPALVSEVWRVLR